MKRISGIVFLIMVLLSGCAALPENYVDGQPLTDKTGILIVGLHTDAPIPTNPIADILALFYKGEGDSDYDNRHIVFQGDSYYAVIPLPAKKYNFDVQSYGPRYWNLDKTPSFTIKPNTITYIGDITSTVVDTYELGVKDQFDMAMQYLRNHYPKLVSSYITEKQITAVAFEAR